MAKPEPVLVPAIRSFVRKGTKRPLAEVMEMAHKHSPEEVIKALGYILKSIVGVGGYRAALENFDPLSAQRQPAVLFAGLMKKLAATPSHMRVGAKTPNVEALCDFCFYNAAVYGKADVMFTLNDDGYRIVVGHSGRQYIYIDFDFDCELHDYLVESLVGERYFEYKSLEFDNPIENRYLYQTIHAYGKGQVGRLTRLNVAFRKKAKPKKGKRVG